MAKKQISVSLRKPPPPADLEKLVVQSVTSGPTSDVRELSSPAPAAASEVEGFVARAKPKTGFCTITVDLPENVADRLMAFCAESGRDVHDVVAEILAKHFASQMQGESEKAQPAAATPAMPTKMEALVGWLRERLQLAGAMRSRLMRLGQMVYASL